jgi:uncharacterized protein (DUF169 family)
MTAYRELAQRFKDALGLRTSPVAVYYADEKPDRAKGFKGVRRGACVIGMAYQASEGISAAFDAANHGCPGAGRNFGFTDKFRPGLAHFLSCGIPGEMEGERYLKTPELAQRYLDGQTIRPAPAKYCVFTPLDHLPDGVEPEVVIFFVRPDILSALVVLADFDNESDESNTFVRFGAGCGQIVSLPLAELESPRPRAVLGLFDVSGRPRVPSDVLSFAIPRPLFLRMAENIPESFLTTESWHKVRVRNLAE